MLLGWLGAGHGHHNAFDNIMDRILSIMLSHFNFYNLNLSVGTSTLRDAHWLCALAPKDYNVARLASSKCSPFAQYWIKFRLSPLVTRTQTHGKMGSRMINTQIVLWKGKLGSQMKMYLKIKCVIMSQFNEFFPKADTIPLFISLHRSLSALTHSQDHVPEALLVINYICAYTHTHTHTCTHEIHRKIH